MVEQTKKQRCAIYTRIANQENIANTTLIQSVTSRWKKVNQVKQICFTWRLWLKCLDAILASESTGYI